MSAVAGRPAWQRGAALVIGLLLLLVTTILGVSAMVSALLELRMAGNVQQQEQAFRAAEFGVEQALHADDLSTSYTLAEPKQVPASGAEPRVPGSDTDSYRYRLYYDTSAGTGSVPGGASLGPGIAALHFIVEATGRSAAGATDVQAQSFFLLVPEECAAASPGCPPLSAYTPIRSGWVQQHAE